MTTTATTPAADDGDGRRRALRRSGRRRCHQASAVHSDGAEQRARRDAPRPQRQVEPRAARRCGPSRPRRATSATPTTTCSARSAREPTRQATTAATSHSTSMIAPRHADGVVDERAGADQLRGDDADHDVEVAQGERGRRRRAPMRRLRRRAEVVERARRMLPGSLRELVGDGRQPQHDADADRPRARCAAAARALRRLPPARRARRRRRARGRPSRRRAAGTARGSGRRTWPRRRAGSSMTMVAAQHGPRGEQHDDPRPAAAGTGSTAGSAAPGRSRATSDGQQGGDGGDARPPEPAAADPQRGGDGDQVDDDRADLQRPRRRARAGGRSGASR